MSTSQASSSQHRLDSIQNEKFAEAGTRPLPSNVRRRTAPTRSSIQQHRRRASQPINASPGAVLSGSFSHPTPEFESSSGSSSEDEDWLRTHVDGSSRNLDDSYGRSLEYLDLSLSLPYTLASLREQLLTHCLHLEAKVRTLCMPYASAATPFKAQNEAASHQQFAAPFYAHIDALKEDLRKLALLLPKYPSSVNMTLPTLPISPQRAGAALVARSQTLAADWDRLLANAKTHTAGFQQNLPQMPVVPSRLAISWPSLPDLEGLPNSGVRLLEKTQLRFDAIQDAVSAVALRDCFYWARARAQTDGGAHASSMSKQFETIFTSIKEKGEAVRQKGHRRATSVAKAARDAEEAMYAAAVDLARNGQRLIRYEHLPTLWKNNEHIHSGYRFIPIEQWGALLKSTFEIHNETGNILTHLIGALIVLPLFWPTKEHDAAYANQSNTPMDRLVQSLYLVAALKCLLLSVSWHVMAGCSDACWFERFACVDYTGIAWLVAASVWTLVYNAFYCQPNLAMFYSLTTLMVGLVGAVVPWASWFNERKNKSLRILVFLSMCFTGLAPFTHASLSHGLPKTFSFFSPILPSIACYIGGLIFYAFQFPERLAPGRFDVWGHAHQFWHISIVLAILLHYRATFIWHAERYAFSCSAQDCSTSTVEAVASSTQKGVGLAIQSASILLDTLGLGDGSGAAADTAAAVVSDLGRADEVVHGWRKAVGKLGGGLVGEAWDWAVDRLMTTF